MRIGVVGIIALGMLTAACGSNTTQRTATASLTGIGVGAAVGGPIGALVGGVAGAAGGAMMPEGADTIAENALHQERTAGRSTLRDAGLAPAAGSSQAPQAQASQTPAGEQLRQAQSELKQQGLYKGKVDGILGPKTKNALTAYQKREGLQQTASLDHDTLQRLGLAAAPMASGTSAATANGTSTPPTSELGPSDLRTRLQQQGYSDVSNIKRNSDNSWNVQARRGGQEMALRVDGQSGRVLSQHELVAAGQPQPSNAPPAADSGSSNSTNAGSDNNSGNNPGTGDTGNNPSGH